MATISVREPKRMEVGAGEPLGVRRVSQSMDTNETHKLKLTEKEIDNRRSHADNLQPSILWSPSDLEVEVYDPESEHNDVSDALLAYSGEAIQNLLDLGSMEHCKDGSSSPEFEAVMEYPLNSQTIAKKDANNPSLFAGINNRTSFTEISSDTPNSEEHHQGEVNSSLLNRTMNLKNFGHESVHTKHVVVEHLTDGISSSRICSPSFGGKDQLKNHIVRDHIGNESTLAKRFSCDNCGVSFEEESCLKIHAKSHQSQKSFCCNSCCKEFSAEEIWIEHMKTHNEKRIYGPKSLFKVSTQSTSLSDRECRTRIHPNDGPSFRGIDDERLGCNRQLKGQIESTVTKETHTCDVCGKKFGCKRNLAEHFWRHTGAKPYACNVCDKRFRQISGFYRHLKRHTREKRFVCDICGKRYEFKQDLSVHLLIHMNKQPFACEFCDESFELKSILEQHIRLHTGGKIFSCYVCDGRFSTKYDLQTHLRLHTGEKSFSSGDCGKNFRHSRDLELHSREYCSKRLVNQASLQTHPSPHTRENVRLYTMDGGSNQQNSHAEIYFSGDACAKSSSRDICLKTHTQEIDVEKNNTDWPKIEEVCIEVDSQNDACKHEYAQLKELRIHLTRYTHDQLLSHSKNLEDERNASVPIKTPYDQELSSHSNDDRDHTAHRTSIECYQSPTYLTAESHPYLVCTKTSADKSPRNTCAEIDVRKKRPTCSVCSKTFASNPALSNHFRVHTGERPYPCHVCGKKFKIMSHLAAHVRIHTGEKPFSCEICCERFTQSVALSRHIRIHNGEKPYSCDVCGKRFIQKSSLKYHLRMHTGERPYPCHICGKSFTRKNSLSIHVLRHTGEKPYSCKVCGNKFRQTSNLRIHMYLHTGKRPFSCTVCGRKFAQKNDLVTHNRIHTGERPYSCKICDKAFMYGSSLKCHMDTHLREARYPCDVCKRRFKRKMDLRDHLRTHSKNNLFSCELCGRVFNQKGNLKSHLLKHNNDEPFSCDDCGKKFPLKSELRRHVVEIHQKQEILSGKLHSCNVCHETFTWIETLKLHLRCHKENNSSANKIATGRISDQDLQGDNLTSLGHEEPVSSNTCCNTDSDEEKRDRHLNLPGHAGYLSCVKILQGEFDQNIKSAHLLSSRTSGVSPTSSIETAATDEGFHREAPSGQEIEEAKSIDNYVRMDDGEEIDIKDELDSLKRETDGSGEMLRISNPDQEECNLHD